jgi:hypothetical protein
MSRPTLFVCRVLYTGLLFAFCGLTYAQSTIFNVPSTDVMPEKKIYLEADFIAHLDKYSKGGFQTYGGRAVYGVTKKFEVGANFFYTRNGTDSPKEMQFNAKYQAYNNEKHGVAISGGGWVFTPLNRAAGRRTYGMVYAVASKKFSRINGLRVTGGVYQMVGAERDSGSKKGWIVGVEQPLFGPLTFTGDWFSGNNKLGYVSAGLSYTFGNQFLQLGYSWGNNGRGNNAFQAFYGVTF